MDVQVNWKVVAVVVLGTILGLGISGMVRNWEELSADPAEFVPIIVTVYGVFPVSDRIVKGLVTL
jgi:hypothetical protein